MALNLRTLVALFLLNVFIGTAHADSIRYLPKSDQGLAQLYLDIKGAKKSVDMTYFIWDPCSTSGKMVQELLKEKTRSNPNFRVRLLIDAIFFSESDRAPFVDTMAKSRIQVRFYNKYDKPNPMANVRSHIKFSVIDGESYITGGRNITDQYFGLDKGHSFIDREVSVKGSSVRTAIHDFEKLWKDSSTFTTEKGDPRKTAELAKSCYALKARDREVISFIEQNAARIQATTQVFDCKQVSFLMDDPAYMDAPGEDDRYLSGERLRLKKATAAIDTILNGATRSIFMENQYVVISDGVEKAMRRARNLKIPVHIFTSLLPDDNYVDALQRDSVAEENHGSVKIQGLSNTGPLNDAWEKSPKIKKWYIHSKTFVVDGQTAIVSSFNVDPRSFHTNLESGAMAVNCPAFAKAVARAGLEYQSMLKKDLECRKCREVPEIDTDTQMRAKAMYNFL